MSQAENDLGRSIHAKEGSADTPQSVLSYIEKWLGRDLTSTEKGRINNLCARYTASVVIGEVFSLRYLVEVKSKTSIGEYLQSRGIAKSIHRVLNERLSRHDTTINGLNEDTQDAQRNYELRKEMYPENIDDQDPQY